MCLAAAVCCGVVATRAALLALRPGPVDRPRFIAAADFNRDGLDDLVIANFHAGTLDLLINQGDGTFAPHENSPISVGIASLRFDQQTSGPLVVLTDDLNPDDVDGDGVENAADNCPNVANVDQFAGDETAAGPDGQCDTSDDNPLLFGPDDTCGNGDDITRSNPVGNPCRVPQDEDADGVLDMPFVDSDGDSIPDYDPVGFGLDNCPLMENTGQEDAETAAGPDGICGTPDDNILLFGDDGVCGPPPEGGMSDDRIGDGVGDACPGSPDLVILENSVGLGSPLGIVRVRVNSGSGGMASRGSLLTGLDPAAILLEDFDADGLLDVVISSSNSNALQLFLGDVDGGFQPQQIISSGDGPRGIVTLDTDRDGDMDLATAVSCDHIVATTLFPLEDNTPIDPADIPPMNEQPTLLLAGTLDNDPFTDLVVFAHEDLVCAGGGPARNGRCCLDDDDCVDPDDDTNVGTCGLGPGRSGRGAIRVLLNRTICDGGPQDGTPCTTDADCADTPPDPATDGTCVPTLAPHAAGSVDLADNERATAGVLTDLDGDGSCGGFEAGSCDIAGTGTCTNTAASGEVCTLNSDCDRSLCDAGGFVGRTCTQDDECSALDLAMTITSLDSGGGRLAVYLGAGDGTFAAPVEVPKVPGFSEPISLTTIDLDPMAPGRPDLTVLDLEVQRAFLFENQSTPGAVSFALTDRNPASPWRGTAAIGLNGVDPLAGVDLVLLQESASRVDIMSGIGNPYFRSVFSVPVEGTSAPTGILFSDLRDDGRPDLLVLDSSTGRITVLTNESFTTFMEAVTLTLPGGFVSAAAGSLSLDVDDYDRDGVPNLLDNCPTRFNPAGCKVADVGCRMEIDCQDTDLAPVDCGIVDPATGQCDSDGNGIGDHCQILNAACSFLDTDGDTFFDYNLAGIPPLSGGDEPDFDGDLIVNRIDNCPTFANPDQVDIEPLPSGNGIGDDCEFLVDGSPIDTDDDGILDFDPATDTLDNCPLIANPGQQDNDVDGVGNICVISAALDDCPFVFNPGQLDADTDGVGDLCAFPVQDVVVVDDSPGSVTPIVGDGSGALYLNPTLHPPITGLATPSAALIGPFSLDCSGLFNTTCFGGPNNDILVAETVVPGDPNDDRLALFRGDGAGGFAVGACDASGACDAVLGGACDISGSCDTGTGLCVAPAAATGDACTVDGDCHRCDAGLSASEGNPCMVDTDCDVLTCSAPTSAAGNLCASDSDCHRCDDSNAASEGSPCLIDLDCRHPAASPAEGDPTLLLSALEQPVCGSPQDPARINLRFDNDARTTVIATLQPSTSSIGIYLPSNQDAVGVCVGGRRDSLFCELEIDCADPADPSNSGTCSARGLPSLVFPPAHTTPLPVPGNLAAAVFEDMNTDGIMDLVVLSSGDGNPATGTNLTLYMGIGNGLFFTDPTINPTDTPDGATLLATANTNLEFDTRAFRPEVVLFFPNEDTDDDGVLDPGEDLNGNGLLDGDRGPLIYENILNERADIDRSGRVDGFDLVVLARSFGATRGEDFSLVVEVDGTLRLAETGSGRCVGGSNDGASCTAESDCTSSNCAGFRRVLDNTGGSFIGTDLPDSGDFCNLLLDPMSVHPQTGEPLYGIAIDINLDGMIDGEDLAIMASRFGQRFSAAP